MKNSSMNKNLLLITLLLFSLSCANEKEEPANLWLTADDIAGVWVDKSNDKFFIRISSDGKYSFCLTSELMGSGEFLLNNNMITFKNKYLSSVDEALIEIIDGELFLSGSFNLMTYEGHERGTGIMKYYKKTKESDPPSFIGKQINFLWVPTSGGYDTKERLEVLSEYIIKYQKIKKSGSIQSTLVDRNWYYVYRNGLFYTQKVDGDGRITLYKDPFTDGYTSRLDGLRVNF